MSKNTITILRSTTNGRPEHGLLPSAFLETPARALCVLCSKVTNDPYSLEACGHRYCRLCLALYVYVVQNNVDVSDESKIKAALRALTAEYEPSEETQFVCCASECDEEFQWDSVNPDRALQKQLARLACRCVNTGCEFNGSCAAYIEHLTECKYADVECEFCSKRFTRREIETHKERCEHRPELKKTCEYCQKQVPSVRYQQHKNSECDDAPATCRLCMRRMQRREVGKHEVDCKLMDGQCVFGCEVDVGTPAKEHYDRNEVVHMEKIRRILDSLESGSGSNAEAVLGGLLPGQITWALSKLEELHQSSTTASQSSSAARNRVDATRLVKIVSTREDSINQRLNEAFERLNKLTSDVDAANRSINENERLALENQSQLNALTINVEKFAEKLQNDNVAIHVLERQAAHANDMTQDGIFVFRVDKFKQRFETAKTSTDKSIYSAPFYTSPNGYKLRLRLFPNGHGATEGVYMAVYVIVCRGEFDAINKWPFTRNVEVACLDQRVSVQTERGADKQPIHKHVVVSLKPDVENQRQAFDRPVMPMNPGFGVADFLALNEGRVFKPLDHEPVYVKDDVIFFRVSVDPFNS